MRHESKITPVTSPLFCNQPKNIKSSRNGSTNSNDDIYFMVTNLFTSPLGESFAMMLLNNTN